MSKHSSYTRSKQRKINPKTKWYADLHEYRLYWEADGHTRGELRRLRREQHTLWIDHPAQHTESV